LLGCAQVLYRGEQGRVAHEFILDIRAIKEASGISETGACVRVCVRAHLLVRA
jgi:glycine cleavage system protein P-like pyridoxal-binding family